ncbi:MAG: DoxX family protein [Proteobacteria bacterium]|nr:DoxX family protein [Pseudomonadota bacterium]
MLNNPAINNLALLAGRVMLSVMFIKAGYDKIGGFAGTQKYMEAFGVPGMLLPLVIVAEIGLGLMVLAGFKTRLAALGLAGFTLIAALIFHRNLMDGTQYLLFMKNIAITGGFLALMVAGAGAYSMDAKQGE